MASDTCSETESLDIDREDGDANDNSDREDDAENEKQTYNDDLVDPQKL